MKDLVFAFTIFLVTLGPLKIVAPFFLITHGKDRRTILVLALKSTIVSTVIALFVASSVVSTMEKWQISIEAVAIAGGILLLVSSIKTISGFALMETPAAEPACDEGSAKEDVHPAPSVVKVPWLGNPVLSPIAIPMIITPIGVVSILCFADAAIGDDAYYFRLIGVLLSIMALNFVAMVMAAPIMRLVGVPILQTVGWVFTALQAGLAVQLIIAAFRRLHIIP